MPRRILEEIEQSTYSSNDRLYMDGEGGAFKITPDNLVRGTTVAQQLAQHIAEAQEEVEQITTDIGNIQTDVNDVKGDIGDLSELETEDKSSLVGAINEARGSGGSGLTADIKTALLQIAQKVAYIDEDGQDYYDDLYDALYAITAIALNTTSITLQTIGATFQLTATTTPAGGNITWSSSNTSVATVSSTGLVTSVTYGSATITATAGSVSATCSVVVAQATCTGITATYTQSGTVYDSDSLDSLKTDLVVTASWSNGTTSTLADTDYTLSGILAEGTSTITVSYSGKTATFNVTVTHLVSYYPKTLTYTDDGVDFGSVDSTKPTQTPPYVVNETKARVHLINTNGIGYPVEAGKTYKITISNPAEHYGGIQTFNTIAQSNLENTEAVDYANKSDTGWLDFSSGEVTFTPTYINGYAPACIWLNFRKNSSGSAAYWSTIDAVEMFPITISEVSQ